MSLVDPHVAAVLAADGLTLTAVAALEEAGVQCLLLKGPSIAGWIYGPGEFRGYGDVDLLVAPDRLAVAERTLKQLGLANRYDGVSPDSAEEHADAWVSAGHIAGVDLHRRLWGVGAAPADAWAVLWASREPIVVNRRAVQALGEPARVLALTLHAAHHGDRSAKALEDLRRGIAAVDPAVWDAAAALARQLGAARGMAGGLGLSAAGAALRDRLGLQPASREEIIVESSSWSLPAGADGLLRLRAARGLRAKAVILGQEIAPSPQFMRTRAAERRTAMRGSGWLYVAYARRWARLLWSLPGATRAVRRRGSPPGP